jgi:hypothetical protein
LTVQLGQVPEQAQLTAIDNQVYGEVEVVPDEEKLTAYAQEIMYFLYRSWTATDDCDNTIVCHQTITVIDTVPPIIPDVPRDTHLDCDDLILLNITAWDAAYAHISYLLQQSIADVGTVIITPTVDGPFPFEKIQGTCKTEYKVKRTWTATDHAGNSLSDTQVITVIDEHAPQWYTIVPPTIHEECDHDPMVDITAHDD